MTETTIGRGDAPTLPPSGLWSSEEGLGRLSTHCKTSEFGDSTAGCHGVAGTNGLLNHCVQQEKESCNAASDALGWFNSVLESPFSLDFLLFI